MSATATAPIPTHDQLVASVQPGYEHPEYGKLVDAEVQALNQPVHTCDDRTCVARSQDTPNWVCIHGAAAINTGWLTKREYERREGGMTHRRITSQRVYKNGLPGAETVIDERFEG